MLLAGAILPFLMVLGYVQANFPLIFLTYGLSLIGLFLGMIGVALHMGDDHDEYE